MLELATLGLLQQEPLHGYRLKQRLERFMSGCISVNYGAVYPLLKRLEERRLISVLVEEEGEAGSGRRIYSITEVGRSAWKEQMLEQPQESWVNSRSRFLIKFFFFSHLEPSDRIKLLKHRLLLCQLRLDSRDLQPDSDDRYQITVLHYSAQMVQTEIQWLERQLQHEQSTVQSPSPAELVEHYGNSNF